MSNTLFGQSLASASSEFGSIYSYSNSDSLHSSSILSASYTSDTLFVRARHYAVCCEKFIKYVDKKDDASQINFVVKSLEKGCICEVEKIVEYRVYLKDLKSVIDLRINGDIPNYGTVAFSNPDLEVTKKKKRKKNKNKEL